MGVRGLTSYIARNAELYLKPHELHDCDLVIDGDNLACNLYKDASDCNSAFGGDYDEYYRTVVAFFHLLFECNIHPFVLLDGGYEQKKMRTVEQRLRGKIAIMKHLNPCNSKPIFPLMMREVFVDAARDCGVKVMRCMFEADDELAILARKLDCAVLSYDSDFYIHNVKYIPLVTVTMRVLTKKEKNNTEEATNLRQCQARNIKKRTKTNNGIKLQQLDDSVVSARVPKTIKYLDCCIYKIENLTTGCKLRKDMLPIFAALLGNDYIESRVFKQFFSKVCMKGTNKKFTKQQRRIVATLRWLKHESKESALEKILTRMKKEQRENLLTQIKSATCGYNEEKSESFNYFNLDEVEHNPSESSEMSSDENNEMKEEDDVEEIKNELIDDLSSDCDEGIDDNTVNVQSDPDVKSDSDDSEKNDFDSSDEQKIDENVDENNTTTTSNQQMFPDWFRQRIYNAQLPRFCVDLLHQQLYVNNPQIENFLYPDCNTVALPILQLLYSLLHFPEKPELRYLSRVIRVTNVEYKRFPSVECGSEFDPTSKSLQAFKDVFSPLKLSTDDKLFEAVQELPSHLQLYFLAIVYWAKKSKYFDLIHFKVLLICVVVLTTVDSKVLPIRDEKLFNKKFKKIIQKERILRAALNDSPNIGHITERQKKTDKTREVLKDLKPYEKIKFVSKVECLLVQENLLKYYRQPQFVHREHNEFSSSTMHGFSEFQAVVFQLYTLNVIVNCPFEPVKMGQMYNGQFLYNLYTNLRSRVDVEYYVQNFILRDSPIMYECYQFLVEWFKPFVTFGNKNDSKKIGKRIRRKKRPQTEEEELKAQSSADVGSGELLESDEDEEFNDLNNKFSTLLSLNK